MGLALLAGLLSGCGGEAKSAKESGAESANKGSGNSGETVTVSMAISGSEQEQKLRYETADLFMKEHPNIKIEWVDIGNERYQKTLTLISGGNAPDILYINDWTLPLATRGVLMPLDDFIQADKSFNLDEFYPSIIEAYKLDGKLYGLPQDLSPTVIYYNKDLFDQAGVPHPTDDWTQDEFVAAAKKLTNPAKKQYGFILSTWNTEYDGWMLRNGASLFTPDMKKSAVDSPEALKGLQLLKQLVVDDHVSPNPAEIQAMGPGDVRFGPLAIARIQGRTAAVQVGRGENAEAGQSSDQNRGFELVDQQRLEASARSVGSSEILRRTRGNENRSQAQHGAACFQRERGESTHYRFEIPG